MKHKHANLIDIQKRKYYEELNIDIYIFYVYT